MIPTNNNNNNRPAIITPEMRLMLEENRPQVFQLGRHEVLEHFGITEFTEEELITTIRLYHIDSLMYMLRVQPGRLQQLDMTEEAYQYAARPPVDTTQNNIFKMFRYLFGVLGTPTASFIGTWIFDANRQFDGGFERVEPMTIIYILRLYNPAEIKPNFDDLNTLVSFHRFARSDYSTGLLRHYLSANLLTDAVYADTISGHLSSWRDDPDVPFGEFDGEEYAIDPHTNVGIAGGDLWEILIYLAMDGRETVFEWIWASFEPHMERLVYALLRSINESDDPDRYRNIVRILERSISEWADDDEDTDELLINPYPRPPLVSGPVFPEEENRHWLRLKYRADAFAVAADRDDAERLAINDRSAVNEAARARARAIAPASSSTAIRPASTRNRPGPSPLNPPWNVTSRARPGPSSYTDEQNRARARAIAPASSSTSIRPASARNRPGPSPLIPPRNVTSRARAGPSSYTDEQNRARERAIAPASSSTAIRTATTRNRLGPSPLNPLRNVTARERDSGLEICAICLQNMGSSILMQPAGTHFVCGHTFCVNCSTMSRIQRCPYCREPSVIDPLPRSPRSDFLFSHC
jgi:predicted Zn-ribbon and HTH transcriptional regulator